eukprot:TRINITY_DN236_c0_g1_i1.p1 TRINITY_DN236_c0_g1~~TRINITY_DN236_c0_g1_i1.p1  ORF type:complete len:924 (-),score=286.55 TRINITY_DN236_c0_g1_i1:13-2748(-)
MDQFLAEAKKDDTWVKLQRKTFTRWINGHLDTKDKSLHMENLEEGLKSGVALHTLLELLSGDTLRKVNAKARMPVQYIENINTCLKYIQQKGIKLVGIGAEDVHDGRTVLVLGLIWTLILRFQIVMDSTDVEMGMSFRDGLLAWCNRVLNPQGIFVKNFTESWQDGRAFCGLVNVLKPGHVDLPSRTADKAVENMDLAFDAAEEHFEFPKLLDAVDVLNTPDDLSIMTYVSYYKHYLATVGAVAQFSFAEGPGLVGGESMTPANFKIITMTKDNEKCVYGGANLFVKLLDAKNIPVCEVDIKDNLDGTYDCTYEAPRAGKFKLDILIGRTSIKDAPFWPVIEPGEPEPGKCTAEGEGLTNAVAGQEAKFKITARDTSSSQLNKGGANFSAVLKDASGDIPVTIVDNKDGTYDCSYVPLKTAKAVELVVKLSTKGYGEGDIDGSSFIVVVTPGAASSETTFCSGEGTKGGKAGESAPVTVTTLDLCGNKVTSGGAPLTATLTFQGEGGVPVNVGVKDNNNGTYSLDYTPEKAGTYLLDVKLGDQSVKDSPFSIVVSAGEFNPLNFTWEGLDLDSEGRRIVVAGNTDSFKVAAKDSFGNALTDGGLAVAGCLSGPSDVEVNVADSNDGSYTLSYTPYKTGLYELLVDVDGVPLGGAPNPCKVLVVPANADGSHSVASGPGLTEGGVGDENPFTIQARDAFDNDIVMGGAQVEGSLVGPDGVEVPIVVVDNGDGTYSCSYPSVKKIGSYQLTPKLNGSPVSGAPFTVTVKPGAFSLENTEVEFPEEHVSSLNGPTIKLKDCDMNLRLGGGDKVTGEILPLDVIDVEAVDKGDGTFDVKYPGNFHGQYKMQIFVNGSDTGVEHVVEVAQKELSAEHAQKYEAVAGRLSEESAAVLKHLLINASEEEREAVLAELK